jgi:hypothetical protein
MSPTACIEASDIPIARTSSRLRFSSSRRLTSKGFLDPNQVYENMLYVDSTTDVKPSSSHSKQSGSESDDQEFKSSSEERTSGETDSRERLHRKKKGFRSMFHYKA